MRYHDPLGIKGGARMEGDWASSRQDENVMPVIELRCGKARE